MEYLMRDHSDQELVASIKEAIGKAFHLEAFETLQASVLDKAEEYYRSNIGEFLDLGHENDSKDPFLERVGRSLRKEVFILRDEDEFLEWIQKKIRESFRKALRERGVPDEKIKAFNKKEDSSPPSNPIDLRGLKEVQSVLWRENSFHEFQKRLFVKVERHHYRNCYSLPPGVSHEIFLETFKDRVGYRILADLQDYEYRNPPSHGAWVGKKIFTTWIDLLRGHMISMKDPEAKGKRRRIPRRVEPKRFANEDEVRFEDFASEDSYLVDLDVPEKPELAVKALKRLASEGITERQFRLWVEKRLEGKGIEEIAEKFGVTERTIHRWFTPRDEEKIERILADFRKEHGYED